MEDQLRVNARKPVARRGKALERGEKKQEEERQERMRWPDLMGESAAPVKRFGCRFVSFSRSRRSHLYALMLT